MKLCYRGVSYEYNPTPVQVAGKRNIVQFRGCSYEMPYAVVNLKTQPQPGVIYRGVSVSEGKSVKFLGRSYEHQETRLIPSTLPQKGEARRKILTTASASSN